MSITDSNSNEMGEDIIFPPSSIDFQGLLMDEINRVIGIKIMLFPTLRNEYHKTILLETNISINWYELN